MDYRLKEQEIRALCEALQTAEAAALAFTTFRVEIFGMILALVRNRDAAQDLLSVFSEDLLRSLPRFRWQCSMRVWCYTLARHATMRHLRSRSQRRRTFVPASSELVEPVRTTTALCQKTDIKQQFRKLREQLDPEDQLLLILRVDRGLSYRDIAVTSLDPDADPAAIERKLVHLRKVFERVKNDLRRLASAQGLLPAHD